MALEKVLVTLNGQQYEAEYTWDDTTSSGTATLTLTAPDTTSWHLPGHYYPIEIQLDASGGFMGRGEHVTTTYTADDLDALRLVVKERQPPAIDLIYPADGYYLTVRDRELKFYITDEVGGSSIDYSTLSVIAAGEDITDTIHAVPTADGYYCTGQIPDRPMGDYSIEISVSDHDGNEATREIGYRYLVLITDRTQADVSSVKSGQKNLVDGKGAYNASDLNRVEMAVEYMTRRLAAYNLRPATKTDWTQGDVPKQSDMARYLSNVRDIRDTLPTGSILPDSMDRLTYVGANQIEKALIDTDELINDIASQYLYAGDIYGGEI